MEQKTNKATDVIFYMEQVGETPIFECFAYFPKMYWNKDLYKTTFTGYAHIGQHTAIHKDYANECKQATIEEYKDLQSELISIGYILNVLNK